HFSASDGEDGVEIVDVIEDEVEVGGATGTLQEIDAATGEAGKGRCVMPACGQGGGLRILRKVAQTHQSAGDPGAADLICFAELTQTAGTDYGDASVTSGQVGGQDRVAAEAGEVGGETR